MQDANSSLLEKTMETADFLSGGLLNPAQQARFVTYVKNFGVTLAMVRFVKMGNPKMDVDRMHVGEPITVSADENTGPTVFQKPKFNKVSLIAHKVRSDWNITTETLQGNIEQDNFEDSVMRAFSRRMTTDFEDLAWNGDVSLYAADNTPTGLLRRRLDGWLKLAGSAHVVDAGGNTIGSAIFNEAKRRLPKQYRNDPALRFFMSDTIADDWLDTLQSRATPLGDAAIAGRGANPAGVPIVRVPIIDDDKALSILAATPAETVGNLYGPFIFTAANKVLRVNINAVGMRVITFTEGTLDLTVVAAAINAVFAANSDKAEAMDNGDGKIFIRTTETGAAKSILVDTIGNGSTANAILGLTAATYTGSNAGTSGTVYEGSTILLGNPLNLIWGLLDGTRVYSEFNTKFDRIETTAFNQVASEIENRDAIVIVKNVRRKTYLTQA